MAGLCYHCPADPQRSSTSCMHSKDQMMGGLTGWLRAPATAGCPRRPAPSEADAAARHFLLANFLPASPGEAAASRVPRPTGRSRPPASRPRRRRPDRRARPRRADHIVEGGTLSLDEARLAIGPVMDGRRRRRSSPRCSWACACAARRSTSLAGFATAMRAGASSTSRRPRGRSMSLGPVATAAGRSTSRPRRR